MGSGSRSSSPPARPLFQNPGLRLGRRGEGQHLHSPRAGRARRGRPPCCTASPRGHSSSSSGPSGTLEERKGRRGVGEGSLPAQASARGPGTLTRLPGPSPQPHLPPGKQQEEQRRRRGWRREEGGKEPEPESPEGDGVGGLRPMTGAGNQPRGMAEMVSKTPIRKDTVPQKIGPGRPPPQEEASWGGKLG